MTFRQFVGGIGVATLGLVVAASPASAQSADAVIELTNIEGSSTIQGKEGMIRVLSYSWGVSNSATTGGRDAGKAVFSDLYLMIGNDKAVPKLFAKTAMGDVIPKATFTVFKTTSGKVQDLIEIVLENVILTGFQVGGSADLPTYSVSMSFGTISLRVWEQRPNGSYVPGTPVSWDIIKNQQ